jgi:membrane fusion protein, copper/silver efflux system
MTANPFEPTPHSARRGLWIAGGIIVIALAITAVLVVGRDTGTVAPATVGVQKTSPTAPTEKPVMLTADAARRIGVTFAPVTLGPLGREVRTVAQVSYDETGLRTISPKIDGWVEQLYVNFTGQPVSVGQPLLSVYSPMLVSAQQELLLAGRLMQSLSGASSDARQGAADLQAAARRRLQYWDISDAQIARLERTGEVLKTLTLRSSANGVVIEKNVQQGQKIMAGEVLYKVADLSTVWIEGEVFERDLSGLRLGSMVNVSLEALPGEKLTGRITYLYPTLNAETRTERIRVALPNPGNRLKPGMYATILIEGTTQSMLSVPRSAVLSTGERNLVFVRGPKGDLEPREVSIGFSTNDRTEILSGVKVGDTVVASATFLVDAESNLSSALGGMGDMPGMEVSTPPKKKE